jgi:tRNA1(Val) A37 N6-methylase TrmN6
VLAPEVGEDRLLGGAVRLRQPRHGYRVAIDAVLLAAAVPAADGDEVADLGAGVGAAALCLLARCPGCRVTGSRTASRWSRPTLPACRRTGTAGSTA